MRELLLCGRRIPLHIERDEDSVDDVRPAAHEEHHVFLAGRFQRLAYPHGRGVGCGHLHQSDVAHSLALRVIARGSEGARGMGSQRLVAIVDPANPEGGDDVLAILDRIENGWNLTRTVVEQHQETLDHLVALGPVVVCESSRIALALATQLAPTEARAA